MHYNFCPVLKKKPTLLLDQIKKEYKIHVFFTGGSVKQVLLLVDFY